MNWYSFIFPQTGLTTATFAVAKALNDNTGFRILGCIFTVALVIVWFLVFGMMIRAIVRKDILWPQKQEDREESDWTLQRKKSSSRRPRGQDLQRGLGDRRQSQEVAQRNTGAEV